MAKMFNMLLIEWSGCLCKRMCRSMNNFAITCQGGVS